MRGASLSRRKKFQSTLPARGATCSVDRQRITHHVSIHAPGEGSDRRWTSRAWRRCFNPRSRRGERRETVDARTAEGFNPRSRRRERRGGSIPWCSLEFQSTLPAKGATGWRSGTWRCGCFNPRSPRRERPPVASSSIISLVSIHAPPAKGATSSDAADDAVFQSTLPAKGATLPASSMHRRFQSTLPAKGAIRLRVPMFQSTLPAKEATRQVLCFSVALDVSIHAPREGSDLLRCSAYGPAVVSIDAPREGSDSPLRRGFREKGVSIHAPGEGSDVVTGCGFQPGHWCFNPCSRRRERRVPTIRKDRSG